MIFYLVPSPYLPKSECVINVHLILKARKEMKVMEAKFVFCFNVYGL